jgi:hypothetical protein
VSIDEGLARRFEICGAARGEVQIAAFSRKGLRSTITDAARAAGNQCGASFEIQFHVIDFWE